MKVSPRTNLSNDALLLLRALQKSYLRGGKPERKPFLRDQHDTRVRIRNVQETEFLLDLLIRRELVERIDENQEYTYHLTPLGIEYVTGERDTGKWQRKRFANTTTAFLPHH
jgi:hypothetical protein